MISKVKKLLLQNSQPPRSVGTSDVARNCNNSNGCTQIDSNITIHKSGVSAVSAIGLSTLGADSYANLRELLSKKVEEKKQQFKQLAMSSDGLPEERMDLDRALRRMDKILDLPDSYLLRDQPEILHVYIGGLINNTLQLDARTLNYVLACTPILNEGQLIQLINHSYTEYMHRGEECQSEFQSALLNVLNLFSLTGASPSTVSNRDFFYLEGMPIVVPKRMPELVFHSLSEKYPTARTKELSDEDVQIISEVSKFLHANGFKALQMALQSVESIGVASFIAPQVHGSFMRLHPSTIVLLINKDVKPFEIAKAAIHEGLHCYVFNMRSKILETKSDTVSVSHLWTGNRARLSSLVEELLTHGLDTCFGLNCLPLLPRESVETQSVNINLPIDILAAKEGIEILDKHADILDEGELRQFAQIKIIWGQLEKITPPQAIEAVEVVYQLGKTLHQISADDTTKTVGETKHSPQRVLATKLTDLQARKHALITEPKLFDYYPTLLELGERMLQFGSFENVKKALEQGVIGPSIGNQRNEYELIKELKGADPKRAKRLEALFKPDRVKRQQSDLLSKAAADGIIPKLADWKKVFNTMIEKGERKLAEKLHLLVLKHWSACNKLEGLYPTHDYENHFGVRERYNFKYDAERGKLLGYSDEDILLYGFYRHLPQGACGENYNVDSFKITDWDFVRGFYENAERWKKQK